MAVLDGNIYDENEVPVIGARVYLYDSTGTLADLTDALGQALDNPVLTDDDGYWRAFVVNEGFYTARTFWGGRERHVEANKTAGRGPIQIVTDELAAAVGVGRYYPTRAAGAAALATGQMFTSDEEGQLAFYKRIAGAPNYEFYDNVPTQAQIDARVQTSLLAAVSGAAMVGFLQSGTGAVARTMQDKGRDIISAADFGINTTNSAAVNTPLFHAMWNAAAGRQCFIDAGSYRYEGSYAGVVNMVGAGMPNVNAARTALVGGTILLGYTNFSSSAGCLRHLGVDHGSAAFGSGGDAIKFSAATYNGGQLVVLDHVVGLGRNDADGFHSVLVEGYAKAILSNCVGSTNQYCFAIKSRNVVFNGLHAIGGQNGIILKSDGSTAGTGSLANVVGSGLLIEGNANTDYGVRILAQNQDIKNVSITGVNMRSVDYGVVVEGAVGTAISNVTITDVTGDDVRNFGIQTGGAGGLYNLIFDNFNLTELGDYAAQFQAGDVTMTNFYGSLKAGSVTHAATMIRAEATLTKFTARGVKLDENLGAGAAKPALYLGLNGLLARVSGLECGLEGVMPAFGGNGQAVSGATATITLLPDLDRLASSTIVTLTADATITTMSPVMPNTTTNVPVGYRWTVENASPFNLTLKSNSNIRTRTGGDKVLTITQTATFMWLGSAWHEI